jgi:hypothetical protein
VKIWRVLVTCFVASYCLVVGFGLLLLVQPWDATTGDWLPSHQQVWYFVPLILQIPGLTAISLALFNQPQEFLLLGFAIFLLISTLRQLKANAETASLARLGRFTFILAGVMVSYRLTIGGRLLPYVGGGTNIYDIRDPGTTLMWLNFESTLILTLVIVHLIIRFKERESRSQPK